MGLLMGGVVHQGGRLKVEFGFARIDLMRPGKPTEYRDHDVGRDQSQKESGDLHGDSPFQSGTCNFIST